MLRNRIRLFVPIIAGATLKERGLACLGAMVGIGVTATTTALLVGPGTNLPALVAPMGASAVLLFAVPSSPMAQPWPIIGGNTISALVGVAVAQSVGSLPLAAAIGVCLAIIAMSVTRSLHPPGGAAALTAVIGGRAIADMGYSFALMPVALNAIILLLAGYIFHRVAGRSYPHKPVPANAHGTSDPPARLRGGIEPEDVDAALKSFGESFDIDRKDLVALLAEVEWRSAIRAGNGSTCADVMSRDVIHVSPDAGIGEARALLVHHNIRTLPVVDDSGGLLGVVGLRQLLGNGGPVSHVMTAATTASPGDPVNTLLPVLTDGSTHGVVIVDESGRVQGVVTQTDVLASMTRGRGDVREHNAA